MSVDAQTRRIHVRSVRRDVCGIVAAYAKTATWRIKRSSPMLDRFERIVLCAFLVYAVIVLVVIMA